VLTDVVGTGVNDAYNTATYKATATKAFEFCEN
jgi:hypothetical protein